MRFNITELDAAKVDRLNDEEIAATAAALAGSNVIRLHAINPWPEDDGADMGTKENDADAIRRLALLPPLELDRVYKDEAESLGVKPATLLAEVKRAKKTSSKDGQSFLASPDPWPEAVDGVALLDRIMQAARDHIKLPDGGGEILALWSLFAHCHDAFEISPPLAITSPTPECGKTTALTFLGAVVPRPLAASNVTSATVFRAVVWAPTFIIDEADTFLAENEELRGILNSGHNRRNAFIFRTVGDDHEPKQFSTWAPKAIAKIGKMPPTLYSRSIRLELQRKTADETVEPLRADRLEHLKPLVQMAARWAADNLNALKASDPEMPKALHGRAADNWRPLIAIADHAGGEWPERVRMIATKAIAKASDETRAIVLLADIKSIFEERGVEQLHSDDLVEAGRNGGSPVGRVEPGKADHQKPTGGAVATVRGDTRSGLVEQQKPERLHPKESQTPIFPVSDR